MREFELLNHIYHVNHQLDADRITIPPGDDMGMIELGKDTSSLLAAVDQVIDGVHFHLRSTPLQLIGRKAVTRSLSDIAAMAAQPVASLCSVVLPRTLEDADCKLLFDAVRTTANTFFCPLIGGDIAVHCDTNQTHSNATGHPLTIAVTVLATPLSPDLPPVRRSGAQPGDTLYVTGRLGGSFRKPDSGHHLTFTPRIDIAQQLYQSIGNQLHAMIDLSDGLGRDASHIADDSHCDIYIDTEKIPRNSNCTWQHAASDGEDYELCFAATGNVPNEIEGIPITAVGTCTIQNDHQQSQISFIERGQKIPGHRLGWQHST